MCFDTAMSVWRRQMRRFFLLELPAALACVSIACWIRYHLPSTVSATAVRGIDVLCVASLVALALVWAFRLPPDRPSAADFLQRE